ncbi:hypothetical protein KR009_000093 [Drosophila setifemur]|nr:hypothetical protein KR009_000093 [Drosophila setifemur]
MDLQALMQQMCYAAAGMPMMMSHPSQPGAPGMMMNLNGYGGYPGGQQPFTPFIPQNGSCEQAAGEELEEDDDEDDEEQRTLFCGNLDERVTEEILYEVFLQAGPIESVRIPTDNTGRQRNFGFVTYQRVCAVPFALDLYQGLELFQKKINIKQQGADKVRQQPAFGQSRNHMRNPFMMEPPSSPSPQRHARHSLHGAKPYDRNVGSQNTDQRRRSDSSVMERNRPRHHHQNLHHQHQQGGSRRPDQRHNQKRRML